MIIKVSKKFETFFIQKQIQEYLMYWYVIDGIREHRFNWRKQKLIQMGFDINKTEEEMNE